MKFGEIPGQEKIKSELLASSKNGKLSHAIMLSGALGIGKLALARAFAQYVNCESPLENDSCGICSSCIKATKNIHPDIHYSYPTVTKKPGEKPIATDFISEWRAYISESTYPSSTEWLSIIQGSGSQNKQGNITVRECREIQKKLALKAFEGKYKILLMWLPEYLGEAGNILLKIVEEPPENTLFIFVCNSTERVLNTILSRTQIINVPRMQDDSVKAHLISLGISEENAIGIAGMSEGSMGRAINMSGEVQTQLHGEMASWLEICAKSQGVKMIQFSDGFAKKSRETQKQFYQYLLSVVRNAQNNRYTMDSNLKGGRGWDMLSIDQFVDFQSDINQAIFYLERNANSKLVMTNLSISLSQMFQNKATFKESNI